MFKIVVKNMIFTIERFAYLWLPLSKEDMRTLKDSLPAPRRATPDSDSRLRS